MGNGSSEKRELADGMGISGHVSIEGYRTDDVRSLHPEWDDASEKERIDILEESDVDPVVTANETNLILDEFLYAHARGNANLPYLAVGDKTAEPNVTNDSLNNETWRTQVGRDEGANNSRLTSTLLSESEANGYGIAEVGFANDDALLTHAILSPGDRIEEKTPGVVVVIYYEIQYQRVE